jgi:hypothetical protein|tara:strand:+ start:140 stop:595 length:456 start_codon:yes stop_codon:yes gene_type:complete
VHNYEQFLTTAFLCATFKLRVCSEELALRIIIFLVVIIISGFAVNKYVFSSKMYDGVSNVTDLVSEYPVDLFKFKKVAQNYAQHLCYTNEGVLAGINVSSSDCVAAHDEMQDQCTDKVFRLAPLNIDSKKELIEYSNEYSRCTLPYKNLTL